MSADSSQPPQPAAPPGEATVRVQQLFVRYQPQLRSFVLALTGVHTAPRSRGRIPFFLFAPTFYGNFGTARGICEAATIALASDQRPPSHTAGWVDV